MRDTFHRCESSGDCSCGPILKNEGVPVSVRLQGHASILLPVPVGDGAGAHRRFATVALSMTQI